MAIQVFKKGDKLPPLPNGIEDIQTQHLFSRYGFKIVDIGGSLFWEAASEDDYRKAEAERLGIEPKDVKPKSSDCHNTSPMTCGGFCDLGDCNLVYQPIQKYYYCACT